MNEDSANDDQAKTESQIRHLVGLIDLTNLNDDCGEEDIIALCKQAETPLGPVAAICIWPSFVRLAKQTLGKTSPISIATVANFPGGDDSFAQTNRLIETAIDDGASEIDYVLPYKQLMAGNTNGVADSVSAVRKAADENIRLKVILETGKLADEHLIRLAATIAVDNGADFIKTSTGKVTVNATPEAAAIMLEVIAQSRRYVGLKPAGGIRTADDASVYLDLCEAQFGKDWINSTHLRFGASGLLQDILHRLKPGTTDTGITAGNY